MVRAFPSRASIVLAAFCLILTATFFTQQRAQGAAADLMLARTLVRPGAVLDPVVSGLVDGRLVRNVAAPLAGQVALPAVPFGFGLTGGQLGALDVTGTAEAVQSVADFTARLRSQGVDVSGVQWTVYTLPPVQEALDARGQNGADGADADPLGSSLIVPAGTVVEFVGAVFEGGQLHAKTTVSAAGERGSSARTFGVMGAPSDSMSWQMAGGKLCLDRKQNSTAHYDPCQQFYNMRNDGDPNWDYWASEMHGTGKSHSVWTLTGLEVDQRRKDGTAGQEWVDWDPGADGKQNCASQSVSVSYAGVGVSVDKQHCELWDIDKGADPADMSNWWRGEVWRSERQVAAMTATRTRAGEVPHDKFDFDFYARP
ncbi:MAG: hypothetical protein ACRDZ3_07160 [Acidimicrobiia bacterium]